MEFDYIRDFEHEGRHVVVTSEDVGSIEIGGGRDYRPIFDPAIYVDGQYVDHRHIPLQPGLYDGEEGYDERLRKYVDWLISRGFV